MPPVSDTEEANRLIKLALSEGGVILTREEILEHIKKPIWMGLPKRLPSGKRGPQSNKTQYNMAYERRKRLFHVLERLPKSGATGRLKQGRRTMSVIERAIYEAPEWLKDEPRKLNGWIVKWLVKNGLEARHRSTIYRSIVKLKKTTND